MSNRTSCCFVLIAVLAQASVSPACAADPVKPAPPEPSPEARQQMAAVHQRMADCLKSDRPIAECRAEVTASSRERMGEAGCPMMGTGGGGMGPGMMGGGMMKGGPPKAPPEE